jgi:uncharacterized membrane protein YkvA (DUF1232 family)
VGERKETPGEPRPVEAGRPAGFRQRWKGRAEGLKADTYALYLACGDPRTPWYAKLLAAGVVVYAVSPIDLIPDFIPVLGFLDDLVIVPLGAALAIRMVPREVMEDCRDKARRTTGAGAPGRTRWLAAAIVVAIWCLIAALVVLTVRAN